MIAVVAIYVVYVQLATVYSYKATLLAVILFMFCMEDTVAIALSPA
jgi:hypothetical protein